MKRSDANTVRRNFLALALPLTRKLYSPSLGISGSLGPIVGEASSHVHQPVTYLWVQHLVTCVT
jgi:hypothetical protein